MFLTSKIKSYFSERGIHKEKETILLRRQQNACLPISLLPNDILETIFLINAPGPENQRIDFVFLASDPNYHTTLAVSRVCFVWRHVALSCALLWSRCLRFNVNTKVAKFQKQLDVLLQRSTPCTVDVNMGGFGYCTQESFDAVLTCASRIKTLDICVDQTQCQGLLDIIQAGNMPSLEAFSVSLNYRSLRETPNLPLFTIKGSVFTQSRRLRRFSCQNFGFDLDFPLYVAEKLISLRVGVDNLAYSHTVSQWLHTLTSMQELQSLSIKELIQNEPVTDSASVIRLSHLTELFIMCYNRTHAFAQQRMTIPISTLLGFLYMPKVRLYDLRVGGVQSDRYLDSIIKHFKRHIWLENPHLLLELDDDSLSIGNQSNSLPDSIQTAALPHFYLQFYPDSGDFLNRSERARITFSCAREIIPMFDDFLSSATNFKLFIPCLSSQYPSRRTIRALYSLLFSALSNVRVCEISVIDTFLLRKLCVFLSDANMFSESPALPALETLTFSHKLIFSDAHSFMFSDFLSMLRFRNQVNSQFGVNLYDHFFLPEQWDEINGLGFVSDTGRQPPLWIEDEFIFSWDTEIQRIE